MWDLGLVSSDGPKDAVSGKILVFWNVFHFLGINWAQIWTKTQNFGYVSFHLQDTILKDYSYTVFAS